MPETSATAYQTEMLIYYLLVPIKQKKQLHTPSRMVGEPSLRVCPPPPPDDLRFREDKAISHEAGADRPKRLLRQPKFAWFDEQVVNTSSTGRNAGTKGFASLSCEQRTLNQNARGVVVFALDAAREGCRHKLKFSRSLSQNVPKAREPCAARS